MFHIILSYSSQNFQADLELFRLIVSQVVKFHLLPPKFLLSVCHRHKFRIAFIDSTASCTGTNLGRSEQILRDITSSVHSIATHTQRFEVGGLPQVFRGGGTFFATNP